MLLANGYMTSGIDTNAQPIPLIIEEQWRCIYCSVVITMRHKQRKEIIDFPCPFCGRPLTLRGREKIYPYDGGRNF